MRSVSAAAEINQAISAMRMVWAVKNITVDCEWEVEFNRHGMLKIKYQIRLIQIGYLSKIDDEYHALLIHTGRLPLQTQHKQHRQLPVNLLSLLGDSSVTIINVNVNGDIDKLGTDFKIQHLFQRRAGKNIIDLGDFVTRRGVTHTRNVGLKQICEDALELTIDKKSEDTLSDWNYTAMK